MTTTPPLADMAYAVTDIPAGGLSTERILSTEALATLAQELGMLSLERATATYRIDRLAGGAYRLKGRVTTVGAQACIVSLDPVASSVDEKFDVEFWPDLPQPDGGEEKAILGARDVEPLEGGIIPVGRIVFETISAGLEPYPRKPGAEFTWSDTAQSDAKKVSPFAALAKLKREP